MSSTYAHILVADDDPDRRRSITDPFHNWDWYAVHIAADVPETLQLLTKFTVDLVILHLSIATATQFTVLKYLRQNSGLRHIPVIVLADPSEMVHVIRCVEYGDVDYLPLPLEPVLLREKIISHLEKQQLFKQALSSMAAFNTMKKVANDLKQVILPLGISLSVEKDLNRILEIIVTKARTICKADTALLYLRTEDDKLRPAAIYNGEKGTIFDQNSSDLSRFEEIPLHKADGEPNDDVAALVTLTQQSANIADIHAYEGKAEFASIRQIDTATDNKTISCLTVPMKSDDVMGVLQLLNARHPDTEAITSFTLYHQQVLESLGSQAAVALQNHVLRRRQEDLIHFEQELEFGRRLQANFLPVEMPKPKGWELAARFQPAREVGGDFYDAFRLRNGKIGLVVADVCDKGVGAAMFMALVRTLIRAFAQRNVLYHTNNGKLDLTDLDHTDTPSVNDAYLEEEQTLFEAVNVTNYYINRNHSQTNMFATLFFGILDPISGQLLYVNSGHNSPIIFHADSGKLRFLQPTGPALGLAATPNFRVGQAVIHPGGTLLIYTDGVTDARDVSGQMFTRERLFSLVPQYAQSAVTLLTKIEDSIQQHIGYAGQFDDIALLAAHRLKTNPN